MRVYYCRGFYYYYYYTNYYPGHPGRGSWGPSTMGWEGRGERGSIRFHAARN